MRLSIGSKLWASFISILIVVLIVGWASFQSSSHLLKTNQSVAHTYQVLAKVSEVFSKLQDAETSSRGYVISGEDRYLQPYQSSLTTIDDSLKELKDLTKDNPNQQKRLEKLNPLVSERLAIVKEGIELRKSQGFEAARELVLTDRGRTVMDQIRNVMREMENEEKALLKHRDEEVSDSTNVTMITIFLGVGIASLIVLGAGILLSRHIATPLKEVTDIAERITKGDLSVNIERSSRTDEVGTLLNTFSSMVKTLQDLAGGATQIAAGDLKVKIKPQSEKDVLGNAFAAMTQNLSEITREISLSVNILPASTSEILTATTQVAASSIETATAVSQTTSTVEEVKQAAQMSAEKARYVSDSAQKVAKFSQSGRKSVQQSIEAMQRIQEQMESIAESIVKLSEQGQAIGEIIATVNDLAEQSNLLAVNAAIEAAKAGDQGKGFAVVAQEVKSLALQSKQATSQVRTILGDIQKATTSAVLATEQGNKTVEAGVQLSGEMGDSINALGDSIDEAARAATQIAVSAQQQLVGMDQVAIAMQNIKQASEQTVASTRETEAAAKSLHELGQKLQQLSIQYQV